MKRSNLIRPVFYTAAILCFVLTPAVAFAQVGQAALSLCKDLAFSTEEDFVTRGPEPPDGNPIISDGDLLGPNCRICARNAELLQIFDVVPNLGLDAADVVDTETYLVAFSTELASSNPGQFTAGDLLVTNGAIIPNQSLTYNFSINYDIGLDAVHFVGGITQIISFLNFAQTISRAEWLASPGRLANELTRYEVDIWFSTEGTPGLASAPTFLDGDLLSVAAGTIVASNDTLFPTSIPAGVPMRGMDFGLDAATADRVPDPNLILFSTEILYPSETVGFSDGDIFLKGSGLVEFHHNLIACFEPVAMFAGIDAFSGSAYLPECSNCGDYNGSGVIELNDVKTFTTQWLWLGPAGGYNHADLNCDGAVQEIDYAIIASQWLDTCP